MRTHVPGDGLGRGGGSSCTPLDASSCRSRQGRCALDPHRGSLFVALLLLSVASIGPTSSEIYGGCGHAVHGGCGRVREAQDRSAALRPDAARVRLLRLRGAGWQEACWIAGSTGLRGGDGAAEALQQRMLQLKVVIPAQSWGAGREERHISAESQSTLETTQGQIDGCFSQLPYKCHQHRVASVGD